MTWVYFKSTTKRPLSLRPSFRQKELFDTSRIFDCRDTRSFTGTRLTFQKMVFLFTSLGAEGAVKEIKIRFDNVTVTVFSSRRPSIHRLIEYCSIKSLLFLSRR